MTKTIKTGTRRYLLELLEDYPYYEKFKEKRINELVNVIPAEDENVGGGKAQNNYRNPIDNLLITVEEDERLRIMARYHFTIKACYEEAPEYVQTICNQLYFKSPRLRKYRTINDLCNANVIYTSKSVAYDDFNMFLINIARQLRLEY